MDLRFRTIDIRGNAEEGGKDPRVILLDLFLLITKNLRKLKKVIVNNTEFYAEYNAFNYSENTKFPFCAFERFRIQFK